MEHKPQVDEFGLEVPALVEDYSLHIIVTGLPITTTKKVEKLEQVVRKVFGKFGEVANTSLPHDEENTKGFGFIEFYDAQIVGKVLRKSQQGGITFDKKHTLAAYPMNALLDLHNGTSFREIEPFQEKKDLFSWLQDTYCRDQFALHQCVKTSVHWMDPHQKPDACMIKSQKNWTDAYVCWSPRGSYFITIHHQGVALWGGSDFAKLHKFPHEHVKIAEFSPCERYLFTITDSDRAPESTPAVCVWEVESSTLLRSFPIKKFEGEKPLLQWSFDGQYLAMLSCEKGSLSVYELPSMNMLEDKSIKIPNIRSFSWSPSDNFLAYWTAEIENQPTRVVILEIPSRTELASRTVFKVKDCAIYWHNKGDYLAARMERTIQKKTSISSLEIFRVREKSIPVESMELKKTVLNFAFENNGNRFCILMGEYPRPDVAFYEISSGGKNSEIKHLNTIEKRNVNAIFWSPQGKFVVLAAVKSGEIEFWNVDQMECLAEEEHSFCTDIVWDPSGRYVCSYSSCWLNIPETVYTIWSAVGQPLFRENADKLAQFIWRPRPPTLLSKEQQKKIKSDLKKLSEKYAMQDRVLSDSVASGLLAKRQSLRQEYYEWRNKRLAVVESERQEYLACYGGVDPEDGVEWVDFENWEDEKVMSKTEEQL
eukprot:GCRY01000848.1.p1 GENE.GCRY01000848.1~~GCRY01000848.1.p1  ORF type:complete len:651 (+),score=100.15 GCRY01000848.1:147-2099(+)